MVEGTIVQNKLELGMNQLMGADTYMGADEDYATLLEQRSNRLTSVNVNPGTVSEVS